MRHALIATFVAVVLTVPAVADLNKYKNWDASPEAYFLTAAEREEWSRVTTDAEAEAFVARYYARRGNDFMEELTVRIQKADQYLSSGNVKGSRTLRGKFAILFGPPAKIERNAREVGANRGSAIMPMQDGGGDARNSGMSLADATSAATMASAVKAGVNIIAVDTMTWSGERVPKPLTEPVVVRIEMDSRGREKLQGSREELAKLDQLIESVARHTLRSSS